MTVASPLAGPFVADGDRILVDIELGGAAATDPRATFEKAGPRAQLAFAPEQTRAAIVTAGGLCPGINNVVRAVVLGLHHGYGVRDVLGFRFGFEGMTSGPEPIALTPDYVRDVHRLGGTLLGTSRGRRSPAVLADELEARGIAILFAIGGNGTLRAAAELVRELDRRRARIAVVAIPKTIDDDISYIDKTFGFDTAVEHARAAIDAAHAEALAVENGVGIVKLMGRDAGFVAAHATIASAEANVCLLPEFPFELASLLPSLERRLAARGHAVIVVAEGCGRSLATATAERDPSGNLRYASRALDIGQHLCEAVQQHCDARGIPIALKYIDPSYTIRAAAANASDAFYCAELGRLAVHAAMAGRTGVLVGRCHGVYAHVPIELALERVPRVGPELWQAVCETTGQLTW